MSRVLTIAACAALGAACATSTLANYDKSGMKLASEGFELRMNNFIQARFTVNDSHDRTQVGGQEVSAQAADWTGFAIRRFETTFGGNVYGKSWVFGTNLTWHSADFLETAFIGYKASKSFEVYGGRAKVQFNLQETTSSKTQQFADRSSTNGAFTQGYASGAWAQGLLPVSEGGAELWYNVGVYNGLYNASYRNSDFANGGGRPAGQDDTTLMYNARLDFAPWGKMSDLKKGESDLRKNDSRDALLMLATVAANYGTERGLAGPARSTPLAGVAVPDATISHMTFGTRIHWSGWSFSGEVLWQGVDFEDDASSLAIDPLDFFPDGLTNMGCIVQLGYNHNLDSGDQVEVAARFALTDYDEYSVNPALAGNGGATRSAVGNDQWEYGVATTYRVAGDNLKLTFDGVYFSASPANIPAAGPNEIPSWQFRLQLQLTF